MMSSRLAPQEMMSRNQQQEMMMLSKAVTENSILTQKNHELINQQISTMNSLAAAQAENASLYAELQALHASLHHVHAVRSSLSAEAASLQQAVLSLSARSDTLQGTVADQQNYIASDLHRRKEISRMLRDRAAAADDVASLRNRRAWHLGAPVSSYGAPVPVGEEILLLASRYAPDVPRLAPSPLQVPLTPPSTTRSVPKCEQRVIEERNHRC